MDLRRDLLDLDAAVREHDAEGADGALTRLRDAWRAMDEEARPALAECIARIKEGISPAEGDLTRIAGG